ncbi:MAG: beta-N-acetylhexosaminidase [Alcanivoracaceae bacterium]|nr:beta-N-acetylhexosaminidase [Alcanivoracaceae bacterium]
MSAQPLLMLDVAGQSLTDEDRELLRHPGTGALILFSRNYANPAQLSALVTEIRAETPDILIAVDQEGGRVQRFRENFSRIPPMRCLGALYDRDVDAALAASRELGLLMAAELIPYGVDISFAPVLDLDFGASSVIGDRSFHADADAVVALVAAFIDGMAAAGMAATGKHFPGHGFVQGDSHLELPVDHRTLDEIRAQDMVPFIKLADRLAGMMLAHIVYAQVDAQPAGFSRFWLQNILRDELGYRGLIFSDDLSMEGAAAAGSYAQRAAVALDAGCDMVLVCNNRAGAIDVLRYLEQRPASPVVPASSMRAQQHQVPTAALQAARNTAMRLLEEAK